MNPADYTSISFPFLGLELNPPRTFPVGPLTVHFYGLILAMGLVLGVIYCSRRSKRAGLTEDDILDGVLWIAPFAIICARIYYVIFSWDMYRNDPISALYIWNGGIAIYGSVIGAVIGVIIFCRIKKCRISALLDLVMMGFLIGQFIGRWGNFFNREAFGAATDSFFRMGLMNRYSGQWEYYHPTFLYESLWNLAAFIALHCYFPKKKFDGEIALIYAAWYGLGRAMIEGLRVDSLYLGSIRVSQLLAAVSCVIALCVLAKLYFKPHKPEELYMNIKAAQLAAAEAEAAEKKEEASEETPAEAESTADAEDAAAEDAAGEESPSAEEAAEEAADAPAEDTPAESEESAET